MRSRSIPTASTRPSRALVGVVALITGVVLLGTPARSVTSDTLAVVKSDQTGVTNSDITALISGVTPPVGDAVMLTRDDNFADSLASGLLQRNGPLFAVPTDGPIPQAVRQRILDIGPTRGIVLGGEAAVGPAILAELEALGITTSRLAGDSRFATATEIARAEAPGATTALLARASAAPGAADPTQAFADTLAAGGFSARRGFPVLLTETGTLAEETAAYLRTSDITRVLVLGGTAAISEATVEEVRSIVDDVQRVAGPTRFDTAIELEKFDGAQDASEATQVILVEGTGTNAFAQTRQGGGAAGPAPWAAGYASANRAFVFDAPILLTANGRVPEPTAAFLAPGIGGDVATAPLLTCTMTGPACELGRQAAGLAAAAVVTVDPPDGALSPGSSVTVSVSGASGPATASGTCLDAPVTFDTATGVTLSVAGSLQPPTCDLVIGDITLADGTVQTETSTYAVGDTRALEGIDTVCALGVDRQEALLYALACNGDGMVHRYDLDGVPLSPASVALPDGVSNDMDIDVIDTDTVVLGARVPAGSLLVVNGEQALGARVVDPLTGATLAGPADLDEAGTTVGAAFDVAAGEIVVLGWDTDTVSRLSAADGVSRTQFGTGPDPDGEAEAFDVFFGDLDLTCSGSMLLVSSAETHANELAADGTFVASHDLGGAVADPSALALDTLSGIAYIAGSGSNVVSRLRTLPVGSCGAPTAPPTTGGGTGGPTTP